MKALIAKLFSRKETFSPNDGNLIWYRLRYEDAAKMGAVLNKLSKHNPIAIRWRARGAEARCHIGVLQEASMTLSKMAKELGFTLEDMPEPPDPLTDRFSTSYTLFTLVSKDEINYAVANEQLSQEQLEDLQGDFDESVELAHLLDGEDESEALADILLAADQMSATDGMSVDEDPVIDLHEGDGWLYKETLFAHDEEGQTKKLSLPSEGNAPRWSLPEPTLGTRVNPEWPTDLVTSQSMFWEQPDWLLGRTARHEMIGSPAVQLYGDDEYTHPWLAALVATREKQGKQTLIIDGEGSFLKHLYTEGRSFDNVYKIDVDGKTTISLNPLVPIVDNGKRNVEATTEKWLTWFRGLNVPESVEPLIAEAAAEPTIVSLETFVDWLTKQTGSRYTSATNLKNFIVPWREDPVTWLLGEGNLAEEILSNRQTLWVKCPFQSLKSRRGVYLSILMAAAALPNISIVLHKVPVRIDDVPGLADTFLVVRDNETIDEQATKVITGSRDIDLLTGMEMISASQVKGVPEFIRQLGEYEAIAVQPNPDAIHTGGERFHITRMSWL